MITLTHEQAEWLGEKILQAFYESEIEDVRGINLARAIILELVPVEAPPVSTWLNKEGEVNE